MTVRATTSSDANYDEGKVPAYTLPDPLVHGDGTPVRDADDWRARRRPELLDLFGREMYGVTPTLTVPMTVAVRSDDPQALRGTATRRELAVTFGDGALTMTVLVFLPNAATAPVPLFMGLNFHGNHTIHDDPEIALPDGLGARQCGATSDWTPRTRGRSRRQRATLARRAHPRTWVRPRHGL